MDMRIISLWAVVFLFLINNYSLSASHIQEKIPPKPFEVSRIKDNIIKIDGHLDEEVWENALILELGIEVYPGKNVQAQEKTRCFLCYDNNNLYVAFKAWERNPSEIRAHLSDRDRISSDDQVGFYIDTFNDEHQGYSFFVNPLGVQADSHRDDFSNGDDRSWDAIWDSSGVITRWGYQVEIAIPFNQLRIQQKEGKQTWGFSGQRTIPRGDNVKNTTQKIDLYNQEYFKQFSKISGFENIASARHIQLTPTFTSFATHYRPDFPEGDFRELASDSRMGLTGSWGISPNITLSGTLNPDFSQIEADAAYLDINLSYALVYPEKRPFFLEGINNFQTLMGIVHTRTVADPRWGIKLLGQEGNSSFGFLAASDRQTNLILPGNQSSRLLYLPIESETTVARYQREVGSNSSLGIIVTDRRGQDYQNQVFALDGTFNLTSSDSIKIQALQSQTQYPEDYSRSWQQPLDSFDGGALKFNYNHFTRSLQYYFYYEGIGNTFRAEAGYVPQVNRNYLNTGVGYTFWFDKNSPLVFAQAFAAFQHSEVSDGRVLYNAFKAWFSVRGPKQSDYYYAYHKYLHQYNGFDYNILTHDIRFAFKPTGNTSLGVTIDMGDRIDYLHDRLGSRLKISPEAGLNLGRNLKISFSHDFERFTVEGQRLYLVNLSQLTAVYSFNSRSFIRLITQYQDTRKNQDLYLNPIEEKTREMFNQILYTYKVNPQTVIYLGYSDNYNHGPDFQLFQKDKTLFFKLSYAWLN